MFREGGVLLQELDNAVGQLSMIEGEAADFVERYQDLDQELLVFGFQWQRKAIDDASQNLEELPHAVEVLCLIDESGKRRRRIF